MQRFPSERLARAGLLMLGLWLLASPPAGASAPLATRLGLGLLCGLPLVLMGALGHRHGARWAVWGVMLLLPFFVLSLGSLVVQPERSLDSSGFAALLVAVLVLLVLRARAPQ
jgi:hypothetical protein